MRVLQASLSILPLLGGCVIVGVSKTETAGHAAATSDTHPAALGDPPPPEAGWSEAEKGVLAKQVQLTFPKRFEKAGESYFSPDDSKVVFQAVEVEPDGKQPEEFYQMYVADLVYDEDGAITGLGEVTRLSPPGSFNTCGWFHPADRDKMIFASTITRPAGGEAPGYQRSGRNYRWRFPPEMNIYEYDFSSGALEPLVVNDGAYLAECSLTADGRHLLYCSLESNEGDLFVKDLDSGRTTRVVGARGYDGGPFFSPDGRRICYRSDRRGNDLLQIFVGDLAFNEAGTIVGLAREYQLTDDENVNFAPFWHPGGRYIVYVSSEYGHHNYEVLVTDADPGDLPGSTGTIKYGTGTRRVTNASGFDGFPAFSSDGTKFLWTSQRDGSGTSQVWAADFVMELDRQ